MITDFISSLNNRDIKLWVEEDKLKFIAPKGIMTPEIKQEILNKKEAIIAFLKEHSSKINLLPPEVHPVSRDKEIPLSFNQQRVWFISQMDPNNAAYNNPVAVRIKGNPESYIIKEALKRMLLRHEILRTSFSIHNRKPVQVINNEMDLFFQEKKFEGVSAEKDLFEEINREIKTPFNLKNGPLFKSYLYQLGPNEYIFVLLIHHIISDGWSLGIFVKEFFILYEALTKNQTPVLPELKIQYADFAHWQRNWLKEDVLKEKIRYWKEKLKGELPVCDMPFDKSRPAVQTYNGRNYKWQISFKLTEKLNQLSQNADVTLFMVLLTAFNILIYRYTGVDDICLGIPVANRVRPELENLLGFFANTIVMRSDMSGDPVFIQLLKKIKQNTIEAYTHQDAPFEKLVEELKPERDLSRSPIYQIMFALQNITVPQLQQKDFSMEMLNLDNGTTQNDLSVYIEETENGLDGISVYNSDLFFHDSIVSLMEHFTRLLEGIVEDPEKQISEYDILTEKTKQSFSLWNNTRTDFPGPSTLSELFEYAAARNPDNIAIIYKKKEITYGELNEKAQKIANFIRSKSDSTVNYIGLCMDRTDLLLTGLLGIIKSGNAYVPLDPFFPIDRLSYIIQDTDAPVIITEEKYRDFVPANDRHVIYLDTDWEMINRQEQIPYNAVRSSNDCAYVIHTSGSTGKPKGVMIPHYCVVNFLKSMEKKLGFLKQDRLLAVTTLSFDISILEIMLPLTTGGTIILADNEDVLDGRRLANLLREKNATFMQATPGTWRVLIGSGWKGMDNLTMLCGGEALPDGLAKELINMGARLFNMYGPTETTIWSSMTLIKADEKITIGTPVDNTQFYILDTHQKMVPVGVTGELYIGGYGVGKGYLNRPELTKEVFIPDPFSGNTGSRLYRTGDMVRWLPDGKVEYIGRIDNQVKVRGYRIELGEIESVLGEYPGILELVVIVREDIHQDKRIVAYLVAKEEPVPAETLTNYCSKKLPGYMIPSVFIWLETMPFTPNGKIDRKSLPAPSTNRPELNTTFIVPKTEMEKQIAGIWQDALKIDSVGINDNFFNLGGHSLLLAEVHIRIQEILNREFSMIELFQYPTISSFVNYLNNNQDEDNSEQQIERMKTGKNRLRQQLNRRRSIGT
ncbi:MAG: amino acid adenylation domain-containing protein [Spirochaetales bacterium]|nr:amino acid adenylation domain-containing protein [Spirochaetales bacterium]